MVLALGMENKLATTLTSYHGTLPLRSLSRVWWSPVRMGEAVVVLGDYAGDCSSATICHRIPD